jgi:hypothetical protein
LLVMTSKSNQGLSNGKLNIRMQTGQDRTNNSRPRKLRMKLTGILNGPQECQSGVSSWSRRDASRHLPDDLPYGTPLIVVATQGDGYTISRLVHLQIQTQQTTGLPGKASGFRQVQNSCDL